VAQLTPASAEPYDLKITEAILGQPVIEKFLMHLGLQARGQAHQAA
jgi:hypothetical protein